jgi:hypothetical protein
MTIQDHSVAGASRDEMEDADAPAPPDAPRESSAPPPPAQPQRVDRAAVVRELAGLFSDDEERVRSRVAAAGNGEQTGRRDQTESDGRKRVEEDEQVNKGLISRLIDGVKGL